MSTFGGTAECPVVVVWRMTADFLAQLAATGGVRRIINPLKFRETGTAFRDQELNHLLS